MIRKPLKILMIVLLVMASLAVAAVGVVVWKIDAFAKDAVDTGTTTAIGLDTRCDRVHVSLLSGNIGVNDLRVSNVDGYKAKHMLEVGDIAVGVQLNSLFDQTLIVPEIRFDNLTLHMEQRGLKNNVSQLLEKLKKRAGEGDAGSASSSKRLQVNRIVLSNITAHVQLLPLGGKETTVKVVVPEIILDDVSPAGARAVAVDEITQRILPAIIAAVLDKGQGVLPADLMVSIGTDLAGAVGAIGSEAGKHVHQAAGGLVKTVLKDVPGALGKTVGGAAEKLGEGLEKGIKGVFEKEKKK